MVALPPSKDESNPLPILVQVGAWRLLARSSATSASVDVPPAPYASADASSASASSILWATVDASSATTMVARRHARTLEADAELSDEACSAEGDAEHARVETHGADAEQA